MLSCSGWCPFTLATKKILFLWSEWLGQRSACLNQTNWFHQRLLGGFLWVSRGWPGLELRKLLYGVAGATMKSKATVHTWYHGGGARRRDKLILSRCLSSGIHLCWLRGYSPAREISWHYQFGFIQSLNSCFFDFEELISNMDSLADNPLWCFTRLFQWDDGVASLYLRISMYFIM